MSDEPKPLPADAQRPAGQTPGLQQQTTVPPPPPAPSAKDGVPRPAMDYAMPTQKKSWLPSPALIKNLGCLIKLLFGFTVLLGMGYFALMALNPKARAWATKGPKDGSGGPTPFKVVNQVLAIPAQALGKTDDVVKANNARAGQVDALVAEEEAKAKGGKGGRTFAPVTDPFATPAADKKPGAASPAAAAESSDSQAVSRAALLALAEKNAATDPDPVEAPATLPEAKASPPDLSAVGPAKAEASATGGVPDSPEQLQLAGNITVAHASPAGAPRASAAFFFWTVNLNVSGITQSKPARMLLNNHLVYEGDIVNRSLGITFARLDTANQLLVFRDQSGATVTRSY